MLQSWNLAKTFLRYVSFIPQSMSVTAEHYFKFLTSEMSTALSLFLSNPAWAQIQDDQVSAL